LAGNWIDASKNLRQFLKDRPASPLAGPARYRLAWCAIATRDYAAGRRRLDDLGVEAARLRGELAAVDDLPSRSPLLGGVLSALVPGAGQAYSGQWVDGLLSLLVNAVFLYGTWEAWQLDNTATAILLGTFETGFYLGNVYGAMNAAHRFNRSSADRFHETLSDRHEFPSGAPPGPVVGPVGQGLSVGVGLD